MENKMCEKFIHRKKVVHVMLRFLTRDRFDEMRQPRSRLNSVTFLSFPNAEDTQQSSRIHASNVWNISIKLIEF